MKFSVALLISLISMSAIGADKKPTYKIKWLLAHEPIGLFVEAAEYFGKRVSEKTNGDIQVEVLTVVDYEKKYNGNKKLRIREVSDHVKTGKAEMSQTYTTDLGRLNKQMWVLDLPFLFRSHDHAQKVLEGDVGKTILAGLRSSNLEGLAFTYSGGYRISPGVKKITKIEDFKGLKVRTSSSPVAQETFNLLGAKAVPMSLADIEKGITSKKIELAESTYPRYYALGQNEVARVMNETNHSLFLTSIIVNGDFYKSLPDDYKKIVSEAAFEAARLERKRSVDSGEEIKAKCEKDGIEIVTMSKGEEERFKEAVRPVYKKFEPMFSKELISSIENQ